MRLTPAAASFITAVATVASVYVTRAITDETYGQINPLFAALGGFVIPSYAVNILRKARTKPKNPRQFVVIATLVIVIPVLLILWIGSNENAYKVQMATQFVVVGLCCSVLVPPALESAESENQ